MSIKDTLRRIKALGSRKMREFVVTPPEPAPDRHGIAIVALVRNVAPYVAEWIRFHQLAGVRAFLLYDNGSTDGTQDALRPFIESGVAQSFPWRLTGEDADTGRRLSAQVSAFAHAVTTFGGRFERFAFIDIDEFLVPKGHDTLTAAIAAAGNPSNLSLPWHMFGHSGHRTPPEGGVIANYTRRARLPYVRPDLLLRHKCIVDPCEVTLISVHKFHTRDMGSHTANTLGQIVPHHRRKSDSFFTSEGIQLNHYYCLSEAEMWNKINRGAASFASHQTYRERVLTKVKEIERDTEEDLCAILFLERAEARKA